MNRYPTDLVRKIYVEYLCGYDAAWLQLCCLHNTRDLDVFRDGSDFVRLLRQFPHRCIDFEPWHGDSGAELEWFEAAHIMPMEFTKQIYRSDCPWLMYRATEMQLVCNDMRDTYPIPSVSEIVLINFRINFRTGFLSTDSILTPSPVPWPLVIRFKISTYMFDRFTKYRWSLRMVPNARSLILDSAIMLWEDWPACVEELDITMYTNTILPAAAIPSLHILHLRLIDINPAALRFLWTLQAPYLIFMQVSEYGCHQAHRYHPDDITAATFSKLRILALYVPNPNWPAWFAKMPVLESLCIHPENSPVPPTHWPPSLKELIVDTGNCYQHDIDTWANAAPKHVEIVFSDSSNTAERILRHKIKCLSP